MNNPPLTLPPCRTRGGGSLPRTGEAGLVLGGGAFNNDHRLTCRTGRVVMHAKGIVDARSPRRVHHFPTAIARPAAPRRNWLRLAVRMGRGRAPTRRRRVGTSVPGPNRCPFRAGGRRVLDDGMRLRVPRPADTPALPSAAASLEGTDGRGLSGWRRQAFRSCRRPGRRPCKRPRCRSPCSFQ